MRVKSSKQALAIQKILEMYTNDERVYTTVGWELFYILDDLQRHRFERIIDEYQKTKRIMK